MPNKMKQLVLGAVAALAACAPHPDTPAASGPGMPEGPETTAGREPVEPRPLPEPGVASRRLASRAGIDVVSYRLSLDLGGLADSAFSATAELRVHATQTLRALPLDLVGLTVRGVALDGEPVPFSYDDVVLDLHPGSPIAAGDTVTVAVAYGGRPKEGLSFETDARGGATAFADNWPNRARWWFPSNDHPSDKATVDFLVRVPAGLEVVANGRLESTGPDPERAGGTVWHWSNAVPIPTYTMVIGVADFGRAVLGEAACGRAPASPGRCATVSVWPLAGDSAFGVQRFARAPDIVDFLTGAIGPFPYAKLAHVESATRFGGMENASAIFYPRLPWERERMGESVIAHETVHQWFGDDVTEARWSDLWLSEGFASYFDPLYYRSRDGDAAFRARMERARQQYITSDVVGYPVVHDTTDLYWLLNANNYQKGAWVLHMLRGVVGDSAFFRGVRRYHAEHAHGTAMTGDFRAAMETEAGEDLGWFFRQWLYEPGYPRLDVTWSGESADGKGGGGGSGAGAGVAGTVAAVVRQTQDPSWPTFRIPTTLLVTLTDGRKVSRDVVLSARAETLRVRVPAPPAAVTLDPGDQVLKTLQVRRAAAPSASGGSGDVRVRERP